LGVEALQFKDGPASRDHRGEATGQGGDWRQLGADAGPVARREVTLQRGLEIEGCEINRCRQIGGQLRRRRATVREAGDQRVVGAQAERGRERAQAAFEFAVERKRGGRTEAQAAGVGFAVRCGGDREIEVTLRQRERSVGGELQIAPHDDALHPARGVAGDLDLAAAADAVVRPRGQQGRGDVERVGDHARATGAQFATLEREIAHNHRLAAVVDDKLGLDARLADDPGQRGGEKR
jgi:hypothetical protein